MTTDLVRDAWQYIVAGIAAIIFVIRMEGRANVHDMEIARLQRQRDADQESALRLREETHIMLRDMNSKLDRLIERNLK